MNLGDLKQRIQKSKEAPPGREYKRWQDKENPLSIPNVIKEYAIVWPQTLRMWALAKKNYGYIETTVKALNESLEKQGKDKKESGGILISKLFPKVINK